MMNNIKNKRWTINNTSRESLKSKGFYYSPKYSNNDESYYIYSFGVAFYNKCPTLYCDIIVRQTDGSVEVNVYSTASGKTYSPFYTDRYQEDNIVVDRINEKIRNKFKELGIKGRK